MKKAMLIVIYTLVIIVLIILSINLFINFHPTFGAKATGESLKRVEQSPHFSDGVFHNLEFTPQMVDAENSSRFETFKKMLFGTPEGRPSEPIETTLFDKKAFTNSDSALFISWFGHSTVLINMNGQVIITDPVFSKAASPVPFFNKAFPFTNPVTVDLLPEIDVVLISHDHYDHLDYQTIKEIDSKTKRFIVPLGVDAHLLRWGIPMEKITVLDWDESYLSEGGTTFRATPSRHFSGRGTSDRNRTQWCSYVISDNKNSVFFSGDSGYGMHFKKIGAEFGPFDVTFMECGQYNEAWKYIHSMPEQAVKAHLELEGKLLIPIHQGKYKLSIHPWQEPLERVKRASAEHGVNLCTPQIGSIVEI